MYGIGSPSRGSQGRRSSIQDGNNRLSPQDPFQSPNRSHSSSMTNGSYISANQRDEVSRTNMSRHSANSGSPSPILSPRHPDHQMSFEEFQHTRSPGKNLARNSKSSNIPVEDDEPMHSSFEELPVEDLNLDDKNVLNESFNSSSFPRDNTSTGTFQTIANLKMEAKRLRMQREKEEERRVAQELHDYLQQEAEEAKRKTIDEKLRTMQDYRKEMERNEFEKEMARENERQRKQAEREVIQKELQSTEKEQARRERERKQQYCRELLAQIQNKKEREEMERTMNRAYIPSPASPLSDDYSPSKDDERRKKEQYRKLLNDQIRDQKQQQAQQRRKEIELERKELQYTFLKGVGMSVEDYEKKKADMRVEYERTWKMETDQRELQKMKQAEEAKMEKLEMEAMLQRIQEEEQHELLERKEAERELARTLQLQSEYALQQKRKEKESNYGYLDSLQFPSSPERYRPGVSRPTTPGSRPQTASPQRSPHSKPTTPGSRPHTPYSDPPLTTTYRRDFYSPTSPTKSAWN